MPSSAASQVIRRRSSQGDCFLAGQNELILTDLALAELVDVLETYCERPRGEDGRQGMR